MYNGHVSQSHKMAIAIDIHTRSTTSLLSARYFGVCVCGGGGNK